MGKHAIETIMGAVVLIVAAGFIMFAYNSSGIATTDGYTINAKFERIDGLNVGSDVRISGIKVGTVTTQRLDPKSYMAEIELNLDQSIKLPKDTTAEIVSDGLLGSKYLALVPGGEEDMLKNGDTIKYTQSSFNIESLIGKFMFSGGGDKDDKNDDENTLDF